jgi:hypothetical protein
MADTGKSRQIGFRIFIASGIILGVVLLVQTVATYVYVSGNLVVQAAEAEARTKGGFLRQSLARLDMDDAAAVDSVLLDALSDWEETVGWLRIRDQRGGIMAEAGASATSDPLSLERFGPGQTAEVPDYEIRTTDLGRVLVVVTRLAGPRRGVFSNVGRGRTPGGNGGPAPGDAGTGDDVSELAPPRPPEGPTPLPPTFLEIAVDMDSVSASFSGLRRNLIIGVSAGFALLFTVLLIAVRFPRYLRGKQLEGQMELARAVQGSLLGSSTPEFRNAEIAADCTPVSQIGGDFYDVFDLSGLTLGVMLGDVSGKGVSAAPLMGFIHGAVHASSWTDSAADHERASLRLNDLLFRKTAPERFVSLFWGYFEPGASVFRYVNAGHCPPMLFRSRTRGNELVRLEDGGPVLGALDDSTYRQGSVEVENGDVMVSYSDGILEATNAFGEEFGEARILSAVRKRWDSPVTAIRDGILKDLDAFRAGNAPSDDQTLVVVRFRPEPASVGSRTGPARAAGVSG